MGEIVRFWVAKLTVRIQRNNPGWGKAEDFEQNLDVLGAAKLKVKNQPNRRSDFGQIDGQKLAKPQVYSCYLRLDFYA